MTKRSRKRRQPTHPAERLRRPRSHVQDAASSATASAAAPIETVRLSFGERVAQRFSRYDAESALRQKVQDFVFQRRFGRDFDRALEQYFGKAVGRRRTFAMDKEELPGLQEWYINDYVMFGGGRLIDLFAKEIGPTLPPVEAALLTTWRSGHVRLLEIQAIQPGVGVDVLDLLSGEAMEIHDRSASRSFQRWMTVLARPHQAENRVCFAGSAIGLPPTYKQQAVEAAQALWATDRARRPGLTLAEFYRGHSLDLMRIMRRLAEEAACPPAILTAEGHPAVVARAEYRLRDAPAVASALDAADEFVITGESDVHPDALHVIWLLRGRSHVPEATSTPKHAVALQGQWSAGPGEPIYRTLGDVVVWPDRLELETMSRERLRAGKGLLASVLGSLVRHRRDEFTDLETLIDAKPGQGETSARPSSRKPSRAEQADLREFAIQQTREWLDAPTPALDGQSPRELVKTPEGQAKVIEWLKSVEFYAEASRARGEPPALNVAFIRRELGLPE